MKAPFVSKEKLEEIIKVYPTPFHIYDEKGIRENAQEFKKAFSWNKGFKEYFAVKACPNPYILKILKEEGFGVDCSSLTELIMAKAVGFSGDEIMFSSNVTPMEDFVYADKLGAIINFDDITHIDFFKKELPLPETMSLRFNPGGTFNINNAIMDTPEEAKYGLTKRQLYDAIRKLKNEGVKHFGLHAFLASNTTNNEYYPELAKMLFSRAVKLKENTDVHIAFINLSGGVGIPYLPDQDKADIFKIADGVKRAYEEILVPAGMEDIAIYTELGRYILGPYGHLVSTVLHKKDIHKQYVGLDACAVNLMRPAMYGAYHHITVIGKENEHKDHIYDVTGGLCENNDKFAIDRMLPETQVGDIVVIHDTGAHGFAMGYNYNGKLRSSEILLHPDGSFSLIRRAETPEDYFVTLDYPELK